MLSTTAYLPLQCHPNPPFEDDDTSINLLNKPSITLASAPMKTPLVSLVLPKQEPLLFDDLDSSFRVDDSHDGLLLTKEEPQLIVEDHDGFPSSPEFYAPCDDSDGTSSSGAGTAPCFEQCATGSTSDSGGGNGRATQQLSPRTCNQSEMSPVVSTTTTTTTTGEPNKKPIKQETSSSLTTQEEKNNLKAQPKVRRRRDIDWQVRGDKKAFQKVLRNRQAAARSNEKRRNIRKQYQKEMEELFDERQRLESRKEELIRMNLTLKAQIVRTYSSGVS